MLTTVEECNDKLSSITNEVREYARQLFAKADAINMSDPCVMTPETFNKLCNIARICDHIQSDFTQAYETITRRDELERHEPLSEPIAQAEERIKEVMAGLFDACVSFSGDVNDVAILDTLDAIVDDMVGAIVEMGDAIHAEHRSNSKQRPDPLAECHFTVTGPTQEE